MVLDEDRRVNNVVPSQFWETKITMNKFYSLGIFVLLLVAGTNSFAQEDCADAVDNDGDGLIDLNDPDCDCPGIGGETTEIESMIPNPSFEDYSCCPTGPSQLSCADGWVQASGATSDYWNFCDFESYPGFNPVGTPLPGDGTGSGWAGFISQPGYSEYIGSCLTGPMLAGTPYVLNMWIALADGNPDLDLTIYGTDDCADLPWTGFACPDGVDGWQILDDVTISTTTDGSWSEVTLNFTPPVDIAAIAIGGPCVEAGIPVGSSYNYYWVDELTIIDSVAFAGGDIEESGDWCFGDLQLESAIDTVGWTCQWYQDGVALPGETSEILDVMAYGAGTFSIVYTLGAECDESSYTIVLPDAPVADFTFTDQCEGEGAMDFTDASVIGSGTIDTWAWDFDDAGATSSDQNPTYTFSGPGTYDVELTVTSASGCTNTITIPVTIYPDPFADFVFSIDGVSSSTGLLGGCLGSTVDFTNNAGVALPDNIILTGWDFGDGNSSVLTDPSHTYAADGTYDVELTVESNNGCQDIITIPVTIFPIPDADFTVDPVCENLDAVFTDISVITSGAIAGWEWDFDDGSAVDVTSGPINHSYGAGAYNPSLVVSSDEGCTDTITIPLDIYAVPNAEFTTSDVCNGEISIFTDASTISAGAIATWSYDFDDGSPLSATASPTHEYIDGGVYNVTLTVTSDNGCVDDTVIAHAVTVGPTASFSTNNVCDGVNATFSDFSFAPSGPITYWEWDFGDGSGLNYTTGSVDHSYASDGTYNVTLVVFAGSAICADTVTVPITIYQLPTVAFVSDPPLICNPDCLRFDDASTGSNPIVSWLWDFGSGATSTDDSPNACFQHQSDYTEYYDITLTVTDSEGCSSSNSFEDYVGVEPTPEALFTFSPDILTVEDPSTAFTNLSRNASTYEWNFNDETPINTEFEPEHSFPSEPAEYLVRLDAYSASGLCHDYFLQLVVVDDILLFHVPNVFTPDGDQYNESFKPIFYSGYDPFDYHLTIFNRWGEIVFESFNADYGWNGDYGTQGLVNEGTYIWQLEFGETMSDKKHTHRGHVTILK